MTLLYRVEDEIAIEMSREAWKRVEGAMDLLTCPDEWHYAQNPALVRELTCFADAIRSHLQHLEAEKPSPPPSNNLDLI